MVSKNFKRNEVHERYVMEKILVRVIDAYIYHYKKNELKFLIIKRSKTKIYEHLWQGVAGKIEERETAWQAAIRELKEETGLKPHKMFVADHISSFYEANFNRINLVPVFGIEVDDTSVTLSEEHCEYKWVEYHNSGNVIREYCYYNGAIQNDMSKCENKSPSSLGGYNSGGYSSGGY